MSPSNRPRKIVGTYSPQASCDTTRRATTLLSGRPSHDSIIPTLSPCMKPCFWPPSNRGKIARRPRARAKSHSAAKPRPSSAQSVRRKTSFASLRLCVTSAWTHVGPKTHRDMAAAHATLLSMPQLTPLQYLTLNLLFAGPQTGQQLRKTTVDNHFEKELRCAVLDDRQGHARDRRLLTTGRYVF